MKIRSIVEIDNGQERHTVPTKSTFNHQYYIQNFQFHIAAYQTLNFIRIIKIKATQRLLS